MKLSQIKHAINESKKMVREAEEEFGGDDFDQFLSSIKEIEKHARERRVLKPDYSKSDLISDIKREIPDIDEKLINKMADFVFGHLGESAQVTEAQSAEELEVGEPVKITGNVQFQGATGVIDSFGTGKRFVIVDLGDNGLHSFHSSDVSYSAEEEQDESAGIEESSNPQDTITMDVPLFIRTLEYAREDAKDDVDLHDTAENAVKLSAGGNTLTMDNYEAMIPSDAVEEATEDAFVSALKGLKTWQVVIFNNYYAGKYSDYRGRYYYVIANSAEQAKQVVLDNADAILKDILSMKSQNGKKILPRSAALPITDKRIGAIKDGTEAGRMSTMGYKRMFGPQGPMMVKLSGGAVEDVQGQEHSVAEGQLDEFGGGGFPKTPKYKVGDLVMVKGYQGVGKIAYIKHRGDVGVIIKEPSPLRVVTTIDDLMPKQGVAEGIDDELQQLTGNYRAIMLGGGLDAAAKQKLTTIYSLLRDPIMKGDEAEYKKMHGYVAAKYPDLFDLLVGADEYVKGVAEGYDDEEHKIKQEAPVEAYGYAYNNRDQRVTWRKNFSSSEAAYKWADKRNATVIGVRPLREVDEAQVNEISDTLRNKYVARASDDYGSANFAARASKSHPGLEKYSQEQAARATKRAAGLNRALSDKRLGRVTESQEDSPAAQAITRRILRQRTDLLAKYGPEKVMQAIDEVAEFVGDLDEIGTSDVSGWVKHVEQLLTNMPSELDEVTLGDYRKKAAMQKAQSQMGAMFARNPEEREKNAATFYKRERGLNRLKARDEAARKAEQARQLADLVARLPELKTEYEQMKARYKALGGSNWQYADRDQNMTTSEREARSMEGAMNNLWRQIQAAEKAQGSK